MTDDDFYIALNDVIYKTTYEKKHIYKYNKILQQQEGNVFNIYAVNIFNIYAVFHNNEGDLFVLFYLFINF